MCGWDGNFTCEIINVIWINKLVPFMRVEVTPRKHSSVLDCLDESTHPNYILLFLLFSLYHPSMTINLPIKVRGNERGFSRHYCQVCVEKERLIRVHTNLPSFPFVRKVVSICDERFTVLSLAALLWGVYWWIFLPSGRNDDREFLNQLLFFCIT